MKRRPVLVAGIVCSLFLASCFFFLCIGVVSARSNTIAAPLGAQLTATTPVQTPALSLSSTPSQSNQPGSQLGFQDYFLQLVSGLIGAVLGVLGTLYATRSQINAIYQQEKENREYVKQQQISIMKYYFMAEMKENINLLEKSGRNVSVSTEAWTIYKGNISSLSVSLQEELITVYTAMKTYNSIVEQISSMFLQHMDNNPLFSSLGEQKKKILTEGENLVKKLTQE